MDTVIIILVFGIIGIVYLSVEIRDFTENKRIISLCNKTIGIIFDFFKAVILGFIIWGIASLLGLEENSINELYATDRPLRFTQWRGAMYSEWFYGGIVLRYIIGLLIRIKKRKIIK